MSEEYNVRFLHSQIAVLIGEFPRTDLLRENLMMGFKEKVDGSFQTLG